MGADPRVGALPAGVQQMPAVSCGPLTNGIALLLFAVAVASMTDDVLSVEQQDDLLDSPVDKMTRSIDALVQSDTEARLHNLGGSGLRDRDIAPNEMRGAVVGSGD